MTKRGKTPDQPDPDKKNTEPSTTHSDDQRFWRALKKNDNIQTLHKPEHDEPARPMHSVSDANQRMPATPNAVHQKPKDLTADLSSLSPRERKRRLVALRSMLAASEARQQQVLGTRLPALAAGVRVAVRSGPYQNRQGTILDADFIHSRVLLDIDQVSDPQWIAFGRLAPVSAEEDPTSNTTA